MCTWGQQLRAIGESAKGRKGFHDDYFCRRVLNTIKRGSFLVRFREFESPDNKIRFQIWKLQKKRALPAVPLGALLVTSPTNHPCPYKPWDPWDLARQASRAYQSHLGELHEVGRGQGFASPLGARCGYDASRKQMLRSINTSRK